MLSAKSVRVLLASAIFLVSVTVIMLSIRPEERVVLAVSLAGLGLLSFGFAHLRKARASWDWERVPGQVLTSRIDKVFDRMEDQQVSKVKIVYSYSVNGRDYKSTQFRLQRSDGNMHNFLEAKTFAERFSAGRAVEVYVNPIDPTDSVLEPGMSDRARSHQLGMIASGLLVLACAAAIKWFLL